VVEALNPERIFLMSGDPVQMAHEVARYVVAAVGAYGNAVLIQDQDEPSDMTLRVGRQLARRIFGARHKGEEIPETLADVIDDPADPDNQAVLRIAIRKAVLADSGCAADVAQMLGYASATGSGVIASGERSVVIGGHNIGIISTGDGTTNIRSQ
jgi:hypothetical protein